MSTLTPLFRCSPFTSREGILNATGRRISLAAGLIGLLGWVTPAAAQTPAAPSPITVNGVIYSQYGYQLKDTANHANSFDVTRAYVNILGKFSGGISTRVTADIAHSAAVGASQTFRLKYAFAAWNPSGSALTYKMGLFTTPWIDWEEALWDYRMQGPTILDRNGYLSSSNFGIGADGNVNHEQVDFQVGAFDNGSYSTGLGDQRKDIEGRVSVRAMNSDDMSRVGGLRITAFGQVGKPVGGGTRSRFVGMVSYKSKTLTLAALGALTSDSTAPGSTVIVKGEVFGGYGVYHFSGSPVALIARLDYVKPNKDAASTVAGFTQTRIIAGVSYQLTANVRLLADLDMLSEANESTLTAGQQAAFDATRQQALFQAQFTF